MDDAPLGGAPKFRKKNLPAGEDGIALCKNVKKVK